MSRTLLLRALASVLTAAALGAAASPAWSAPTIKNISLRGLQTGAVTTVIIDGDGLLPDPKIVLPVPIAAQSVKGKPTANRIEVEITLAAEVTPGIYPLRVALADGISNRVFVGVDHLPEKAMAEKVEGLPVALTGRVSGPVIARTTFAGKAQQRVVVEVESRRLGGDITPVLKLYNPRGVQIAWVQDQSPLAGDARIVATLPADGEYAVEVHDATFKGGQNNFYRLKIGDYQFADFVHPLGGTRGQKTNLALMGAGESKPIEADLTHAMADVPAPWPAGQGFSGAAPRVFVSELREVAEPAGVLAAGAAAHDAGAVPVAISGRLAAKGQTDKFRINVQPKQKLRFNVLAERIGARLDGVLVLMNEQGGRLAENDDPNPATTSDPSLDYTVPDNVQPLVVAIHDRVMAGGPDSVYRIVVTEAGKPDFALQALSDSASTPQNGTSVIRVRANRMGYGGPIKLSIPGLPAGVVLAGDEIPAGATDTLLSLTAPAGAALVQGVQNLVGRGGEAANEIIRVAQVGMRSSLQPWNDRELALAITPPGKLQVGWNTADPRLPLGYRYPARVNVTRAEGAMGPVRLSLLTSQIVPTKKEQNKDVEDVAKALRIEGASMIAAEQATGEAQVVVPPDLPVMPYDLVVRAELLSADGKNVLATAFTPSRRLLPEAPVHLQLASDKKIEAKAGAGATGKFTGKIVRAEGFKSEVTVTLEGLPAELPPPEVDVPADKDDFALEVAFPFGSKLQDLKGVKLVGKTEGALALTTPPVPVEIKLVQGDAPPPPPALYRVFEDEKYFTALLNEGKGKIDLERADRYSGKVALKVTPDQRFRTALPNLGYMVKENPGPGEFRYLRFAWKKRGGNNILLQLATGGKFGPTQGQSGASFRYESGADNPYKALAIKLEKQVPSKWVVVTRDLFADFGEFKLEGLAFTATDGQEALFDHIYLAKTQDDLKGCPEPVPGEAPLAIFEDQPEFIAALTEGGGTATLDTSDKYSGKASVKVTPDQKFNPALPGLGVKIRENPGPGEYRYIRYAWRKQGGQSICLQINHDGQWGPQGGNPAKFRYHAGPNEVYGASVPVDAKLPGRFTVVTRDLYADFGEFTFTGIALSPVDGDAGQWDHIYLGKTPRDFELVAP